MEERKQNVLIVHNFYKIPGGEDTVVENERKMLEENNHKVILYTRNNREMDSFNKWQKLLLPIMTIFNPKTYKEIKKIIKDNDIDIVHIHNTLLLISPSVYYAAMKCKVPVVQTVHNFRLLCPGATFYRAGHICEDCVTKGLRCAVKHKCYRNSRLQTVMCVINTKIHRLTKIYSKINYICLTEFNKEKLLSLKQVKKDKVFVKPNFVNNEDEIISHCNRENQFVFAGRLDKLKGIDLLLQAWKKIEYDDEAPRLIICGTGIMENWCKQYIKENSLNTIEMKGFLPGKAVKEIVSKSKALILPTQWYEGFPMSIVESFAVGTPVIATDIGNTGNLIHDGVNGYKLKGDLYEALIDVLKKLKSNNEIYQRTESEYMLKYTEEINYRELIKIYDKVV